MPGWNKFSRLRNWCAAIFLLGVAVRVPLVLMTHSRELARVEPVNIAVSLATRGTYADAYGKDTGPTAHCAPLHPILLSALISVFGTGASGSLAVSVAASMAASLAFALLPALAVAAGVGAAAGIVGGLGGALLPINFWSQTTGTFDAPFTALALVVLLVLSCRIWDNGLFTTRDGALFGVASGIGCLINPALVQVTLLWAILAFLRFQARLQVLRFLLLSGACFLCTVAPWAIRNYEVLGSPIWTRSNFWLEVQVSNNDLATPSLESNIPSFSHMHPYLAPAERTRVRVMGELAYNRAKRREALDWVASHKAQFALLTVEHFRLFWFPVMKRPWQTYSESALTLLGLVGLAVILARGGAAAWSIGAAFASYPIVYYLIEVSPRYRLPIESLLYLTAGFSVVLACPSILKRSKPSGHERTAAREAPSVSE
jgi:hypothetical protein